MTKNESEAMLLSGNPKKLYARLMETKKVLHDYLDQYFTKNTFDFENKRLVSDNDKLYLQWRLRLHPDQLESYENQQTSTGTVVIVIPDLKKE